LLGSPSLSGGCDLPDLLGIDFDTVLDMTRQTSLTPIRLPNGLGVWAQASMRGHDGVDFGHALAFSSFSEVMTSSVMPNARSADNGLQKQSVSVDSETVADMEALSVPPALARLSEHHHHVIDRTLAECDGNISRAARTLGVSRGLVYRHLRNRQDAAESSPQID